VTSISTIHTECIVVPTPTVVTPTRYSVPLYVHGIACSTNRFLWHIPGWMSKLWIF